MFELFLKGMAIGFSIAMPIGPIGMLCIRNSISRGFTFGLATGMGAALADGIYGAVAGFGVTAVAHILSMYSIWFQLAGAVFLLYLGVVTFFAEPEHELPASLQRGHFTVLLTTFLLTLTNPVTIFAFAGVYAALGIGIENEGIIMPLVLTSGVFFGSVIWFLLLSASAAFFGRKFQVKSSKSNLLNHISGIILIAFGVIALLAGLQMLIMKK